MTYVPISKTSVTSDTTTVGQRGFSVALVLGQHNYFLERIKFYGSIEEAAVDLPAYSKEYKAVESAFGANPDLPSVAVGRRLCNSTLLPATPTTGDQFKVRITHSTGFQDITVTAGGGDTVTSIGTALAAAINIPALSTVVTAASVAGLVTLTKVGSAVYKISALEKLTAGFVASVEPEATTMNAIIAENRDFYYVVSTDRTSTHLLALAAYIKATDYVMSYATSLADVYGTTLSGSSTDWPATIKLGGNENVINPCYVQADQLDLFPELRIFAVRALSQPGDVIYSNITNTGIQPGKTAEGLLLTESQRDFIASRGLSYFEYNQGGVVAFRRGFSQAAGASAWADDTVIKHFFKARCNEAVTNRFFQTNSGKVAGLPGYTAIQNVIQAVGDAMTSIGSNVRAFQENSFKITLPTPDEIRSYRESRVAKFKISYKLEGAFDSAEVYLSLSF